MKNNSFVSKVVTLSAAAVIAVTSITTSAFAQSEKVSSEITGTSAVTGGTIGFTSINAALNGAEQTPTANWSIEDIVDARGTGAGWELTLDLTQFKEVNTETEAYVDGGKTLETGSLTVSTVPTVEAGATSSSAADINTVLENQPLDGNTQKIVYATPDNGMGTFIIGDLGVTLTIPASTYAKTYKTDATVTLSQSGVTAP